MEKVFQNNNPNKTQPGFAKPGTEFPSPPISMFSAKVNSSTKHSGRYFNQQEDEDGAIRGSFSNEMSPVKDIQAHRVFK